MKHLVAISLLLSSYPLLAVAVEGNVQPQQYVSQGSVSVGGEKIAYHATAGTLILKNDKNEPTVSMFYVAYVKDGGDAVHRPIAFLFNGGPGSSTIWLHMGAFGPARVKTEDHAHTPAAPYSLVNNEDSLLDAADLVFIDAPGTGFSRVLDKDHGGVGTTQDFYGVDQDGRAFADFIEQYLSQHGRWNSPKYLLGESYGTIRAPVVASDLEGDSVELNGVILVSAIPNLDISPDREIFNPSVDLPYALSLPTQAAIAWYQHKLPQQPPELEPFLKEVEHFALVDYLGALQAGPNLDTTARRQLAERLHGYTGLAAEYWLRAGLRVSGPQFEEELLRDSEQVVGRLDGRFAGPLLDPLSETADYDPQSAAISSAYNTLFNDYVRKQLGYSTDLTYIPLSGDVERQWDFKHAPPGAGPLQIATNVLPDLAAVMVQNPNLKVMLNSGYYDLSTPYFAAVYELRHLPMPDELQKNIEYAYYPSGHMIYANEASAKAFHDNVKRFIDSSHGNAE